MAVFLNFLWLEYCEINRSHKNGMLDYSFVVQMIECICSLSTKCSINLSDSPSSFKSRQVSRPQHLSWCVSVSSISVINNNKDGQNNEN